MSSVSKEFTSPPHLSTQKQSSSQRLQNLFEQLEQETAGTERFHRIRGQIFQEIGRTYERINHQPVHFFENDNCLKNAELVNQRKKFSKHPGSLKRLDVPTKEYLESFQIFRRAFQTNQEESFETILNDFVVKHNAFAPIYLSELKRVYATSKTMLNIYKSDITDFVKAFQLFIKELRQPLLSDISEQIDCSSQEIQDLLPKLALYQALYSNDLPKIFYKHTQEFSEVKPQFLKLSQPEQKKIRDSLIDPSKPPLSPEAQDILNTIERIAKDSFEGDQKKLGAVILKETLQKLKSSLAPPKKTPHTISSQKSSLPVNHRNEIELQSFV